MKSKRTWRMEGMMQFKNSTGSWRVSHWALLHVKHSWEEQAMQENSLSQQELKVTEISSSWRLFRKGFAFCSVTLWFEQGSCGLLWDMYTNALPGDVSDDTHGVWGGWRGSVGSLKPTAVKALIGPGRFFNIFKYPHESKNTTSGNWNCQMLRLSSSLAVTCMWKRFPVNSLWQMAF